MKRLELLMSVMHQSDFSLLGQSKMFGNVLVINQCDTNAYDEEQHNGYEWRMISSTDRGLSRSRNLAIDKAQGEICKLCDDDETLAEGYEDIILKAYEELPDADVIVFNVNRINYRMKKTYYKIKEVHSAPSFRYYQSAMITFRLDKIKANKIRFNELFGSGTKLGGGEDNLFIRDVRRANLKVYEYPATISTLDYGRFGSNWFHGYDDKYFYNLGVFSEYVKPHNTLNNIIWGIYQFYKLRNEKLSLFKIIKWRLAGAKGFRNGKLSYEEYLEK